GGQRMQGPIQALVTGILLRGLSPALLPVLMAAPARKAVRAQLKKIYVLDDRGEMSGEYILDADCPIDYDDFLKVLPPEGIGDRDSLFVGEYVFTAFQSGKFVFVLLSRGHLASDADPRDAEPARLEAGPRNEEGRSEDDGGGPASVRTAAQGHHRGKERTRDSIFGGARSSREDSTGGALGGRHARERAERCR